MTRRFFSSVLRSSQRIAASVMVVFLATSPASAQSDAVCDPDKVFAAAQSLFFQPPVDLRIRGISVRIPDRPAANADIGRWGDTRTNTDGSVRFHAGVDVLGDIGEVIIAPIDGVIDSGRVNGLGRFVDLNFQVAVLDPPAICNVHFRFAHLSEIIVDEGQISAGAAIGKIGRDGNAVGGTIPTHVHIEFWAIPQTQRGQDQQASTRDPMRLFGW